VRRRCEPRGAGRASAHTCLLLICLLSWERSSSSWTTRHGDGRAMHRGTVAREEVNNARARATHSVRMLSVRAYERARGGDGGGGQRAGHACPGRQRGAVRGDDAGGSARGPSCTCCSIARLSMVVCTETPAHGTSRAGPTAGGASARCACTQRTCPRKRGSNAAGSGPDARRATVSFTVSNFPSFRSHTSPRVRRTRPPATLLI